MSTICSPLPGCPQKLLTWAALTCSLQISNFAAQTRRRRSSKDKKKSGGKHPNLSSSVLFWGVKGGGGRKGGLRRGGGEWIRAAAPPAPAPRAAPPGRRHPERDRPPLRPRSEQGVAELLRQHRVPPSPTPAPPFFLFCQVIFPGRDIFNKGRLLRRRFEGSPLKPCVH